MQVGAETMHTRPKQAHTQTVQPQLSHRHRPKVAR